MGTNAAIDVAIGLVLMYLILSLVCTVVNEAISTMLSWRASTLSAGIAKLLDDPNVRQAFQNHGLIKAANAASGPGGPSYLSGESFALALIGCLDPTKPIPQFLDVQSAIKALPESSIRGVMLAQMTAAGGSLDKLRQGIASWFDAAMDRVSGVYKRKLKLTAILVGLLIAIAFGADSIQVAESLWKDPTLRAASVQSAQEFSKQPPSANTSGTEPENRLAKCTPDARTTSAASANAKQQVDFECFNTYMNALRPLPLGWQMPGRDATSSWGGWMTWIGVKSLGLVLTALALSLGAPFWFDLLGKFVNLRGSGIKPLRADETST